MEVGLAGIVFGLVFLRFGIVPVVIAHFSVDALYTAFVLIRSESPYYVITGSLSAFLWIRAGSAAGAHPSIRTYSLLGLVIAPLTIIGSLAALALG